MVACGQWWSICGRRYLFSSIKLSGHRGSSILCHCFVPVVVGIGSGFCSWHDLLGTEQPYSAAEQHNQVQMNVVCSGEPCLLQVGWLKSEAVPGGDLNSSLDLAAV